MKKKHLKLGSCALMASLLTLSSCVDNDYDLTKDIDLTIQVGWKRIRYSRRRN